MTIDIRDSARKASCQQPCHASSVNDGSKKYRAIARRLATKPMSPASTRAPQSLAGKTRAAGGIGTGRGKLVASPLATGTAEPWLWASPVRKGRALMHEPTAAPLPTGAPAERLWTVHDVAAYPVDGEPSVRFQLDSFALRSYEAASWAGKNRCFDAGGCAGRGGASGRTPGPSPVCHFRLTSVDGVAPRVTQKWLSARAGRSKPPSGLISRVVAVTIPHAATAPRPAASPP